MAKLLTRDIELPELDFSSDTPWEDQPQQIALNALTERSDALPKGEIVGAVIKFPVADGHAYYLVTKEKPLTLQYIFYGDGYYVHPAMIRGLNKQDILDQLENRRWWNDLATKANKE